MIGKIGKFLLIIGGTLLASAASASAQTVDATTLDNKILAGYQGWFRTPGDVAGTNTMAHWFSGAPSQSTEVFDTWPDLSEFSAGEVATVPNFKYPDGSPATLYSGQNASAVLHHFQWMQQEGIDGIWLSEFITHTPLAGGTNAGDWPYVQRILNNARAAATSTGRTWAFLYDTSGASTSAVVNATEQQWKNMVDQGYTSDPRYLHQNGLPAVMLYGFFYNDTNHVIGNPAIGNALIQFFHTPGKYQAYLVGSGQWYWAQAGSTSTDFQNMLFTLDAYVPWNVGHTTKTTDGTIKAQTGTWASDKAAFESHGVKFIPLVYPGTDNAGPPRATQVAPHRQGKFYWEQFVTASQLGTSDAIFVAMYDELNEATAIMPVTNTPPVQTPPFYTYEGYPAHWYEQLTYAGEYYLKNNLPVPATIPLSPTPAVLSSVTTTASGLAYSRVSQTFNGTVTITNTSSTPAFGPFRLVLSSLTSGAKLLSATGTYQGSQYLSVPNDLLSLAPGQSTTLSVQFSNPSMASIHFTPVVYGGRF